MGHVWCVALAVVGVLLFVAGRAWAILDRDVGSEVPPATVQASGGSSGSASVLDATGYVVARRMATVSAKITGKVLEVRIEEGQRVEEGDIMATLDPVDADAERALAASQLAARSEEHTSELQSLMRNSYAVVCWEKKTHTSN